jgi:hypothetical protein
METGDGSHANKDLLEVGADMDEDIEDQGLLSEEEDDDSPPIVLDFDVADAAVAHKFVIIGHFLMVGGYSFMGLFETMK